MQCFAPAEWVGPHTASREWAQVCFKGHRPQNNWISTMIHSVRFSGLLLFKPNGLIAYLWTKISLYIDQHGFISNPHWLERLLMSPVWLTMVQSASLNVKNTSFVTKTVSHCRQQSHKFVPNISLQSSRKHFIYPTDSCLHISSPWVHFLRPVCSTLQSHHTLLC